jgi:hypothetical protein
MKTEREKMLAGELHNALDPELVQDRERARDLCQMDISKPWKVRKSSTRADHLLPLFSVSYPSKSGST